MEELKIELSINKNIIDKHIGGKKKFFSEGWEPYDLTLQQLSDHINQGHAFGPQFDERIRKGQNFLGAGFVVIDVDGTFKIADALSHPFIQQYGSIFYTTPSHMQDGEERFRVIFALEEPIESGANYKWALLGLAERFGTDRNISDSARILYGSRNSSPTILGNTLPKKELKQLIKEGRKAEAVLRRAKVATEEASNDEQSHHDALDRTKETISPKQLLTTEHGNSLRLSDLPTQTRIFCPFHADKHPSAFTLKSHRGAPGVWCSTCRKTWWLEGSLPPTYNFYAFDGVVKRAAAQIADKNSERAADGRDRWNKEAIVIDEQFLPTMPLHEGMILVKSPKGSGKTTALKQLVRDAKAQGKSVLLIGHRQTLLRVLSSKLGLACYMDDPPPVRKKKKAQRPDYYAISVDSLPKRLGRPRPYDVVIVDESEQVFSHVTARTLKNAHGVMTRLHSYVADAKSIYLFDADLNWVTLGFVATARAKNPSQPVKFVLNTYVPPERECQMFSSPSALITDMTKAARAGKRIFVACNSKKRAQVFAKLLRKDIGETLRVLLVTSEEKASDEVQRFLSDVPKHILNYDVVVASPAIGTGIDITFPDGAKEIDVLYGFFYPGVNSHYDIDQQLGRVRNPGEVKVWVSPRQYRFEIEKDAVKRDLAETGDTHSAVSGFVDGHPVIDMNHPLLELQAAAYCAQRASMNRMKDYFIRHKKLNGWKIVAVSQDAVDETQIRDKLKELSNEIDEEQLNGILSAKTINEATWRQYSQRKGIGEAIGQAAKFEMARFELRNFYNCPVTADLVRLDAGGTFRESILRYEQLGIGNATSLHFLQGGWNRYRENEQKFAEAMGSGTQRSLIAILLSCGLLDESGIKGDAVLSKHDLKNFLAYCDERSITIERDLDIALRKDRNRDPMKMLNEFLALIGLTMQCLGKTRKAGVATYRYQLVPEPLKQVTGIVQRRKKGPPRSTLPETLQPPRIRKKVEVVTNTLFDSA